MSSDSNKTSKKSAIHHSKKRIPKCTLNILQNSRIRYKKLKISLIIFEKKDNNFIKVLASKKQ